MGSFTNFLFARPSFIEGMARILDLGGTMQVYNVSYSPEEADARALAADWYAIGEDLKKAVAIVTADLKAQELRSSQ